MRFFAPGQRKGVAMLGSILFAVLLVVAACGSSGSSKVAPGKAGNTISWAEPPSTTPNWIWPFSPLADFSLINGQMQGLMYRPLYAFGADGNADFSPNVSLAQQPSYDSTGTVATITLKNYMWSDGTPVTANDVMFWINMNIAEKKNFAAYTPTYWPDNIVSAKATNPTTVTITFDKAYNQRWMLWNELSQITPMPPKWDTTDGTNTSDCDTNVNDCAAVYTYMTAQAKDLKTYATNPLWQVVDGPWKLKSFNSDGNVSFVPNPSYSGPNKATTKQFNMVPFTSDTAEFQVLQSGKTLDVGYLPSQDVKQPKPANTPPNKAGPNPLSGFTLVPWFNYAINYFALNFGNPTVGPIFNQLYFRQALEMVYDQKAIIKAAAKNYGIPTTGPVPLFPNSSLITSYEKSNPYPFNISKAKSLLTSNGWDVKPGGTSTCSKPGSGAGECGAGIQAGAKLSFQLPYSTGDQRTKTAMESLKSDASKIGIQLTLSEKPFDTVIADATQCSGPTCTWQMANWGGGWIYAPDYYPSGETLWQTGAGSNSGNYSNPTLDALIAKTTVGNDPTAWQQYVDTTAKDLPVIWQPNYTYQLTEIASGLKGAQVQDPFGAIYPETWHYV